MGCNLRLLLKSRPKLGRHSQFYQILYKIKKMAPELLKSFFNSQNVTLHQFWADAPLNRAAVSLIPLNQTGKERLISLSVSVRGASRRLPPHPQQAGGNISGRARLLGWLVRFLHSFTPAPALKRIHNRIRNETAACLCLLSPAVRIQPVR